MSKTVDKLVSSVVNCTQNSSDKVFTKRLDQLRELGKLGKKKANRGAVLDGFETVARESSVPVLASLAVIHMADLLTPGDTDRVPFLKKALADENLAEGAALSLVKVLGADAYPDLVKVICNTKRELVTRHCALEALCEHSGQPFMDGIPIYLDEVKPSHIPVKEVRAWSKAGYPKYVRPVVKLPDKQLATAGIKLPEAYREFLLEYHKGGEWENEDTWQLMPASELFQKIDVDGTKVPAIQSLKAYARTLRDVLDGGVTEDHKGKPYPLDRLAAGVVIGTGGSGDILYLDPADDDAVWIFHPDGGDVERVTKTFKTWLKQSEKM
jgi:hypothetical protein